MQQVKWLFIFFIVIVVQSSFVQLIAIHDIRPDILIIVLVLYSFQNGQMKSTIAGFFIGLVQDLLSGGMLGLSSFTKSIAGFLSGVVSRKDKPSTTKSFVITITIVTIIHNILFFSLYTIGVEISGANLILYSVLPASVYTILLGVLVYSIISVYK